MREGLHRLGAAAFRLFALATHLTIAACARHDVDEEAPGFLGAGASDPAAIEAEREFWEQVHETDRHEREHPTERGGVYDAGDLDPSPIYRGDVEGVYPPSDNIDIDRPTDPETRESGS